MIRKVNAKVIGKWMKGIIFKTPMLSVDFIKNEINPRYYDLPVTMAFWNAAKIEDKVVISMELNEKDNLWYPM